MQADVVMLQAILELLELRPTIVRGNASEILALGGAGGVTKGVDSTAQSHEALETAKSIALQYSTVVAVSGEIDMVGGSTRSFRTALPGIK